MTVLSERERLKELVRGTLITQGVYPKLKAQLRANVFQALQSDDSFQNEEKPEITVLDELILAYLKQKKHLPYSCSVFAAESNLEKSTSYSSDVEKLVHQLEVDPGFVLLSLLKDSIQMEEDLTGTTKVIKRLPTSEEKVSPLDTVTTESTENTSKSASNVVENLVPTEEGSTPKKKNPLLESKESVMNESINDPNEEYNYEFSEPDSEYNDSNFSDDFMDKSQTSEKSLDLDFNDDEFNLGNESLENSENFSDVTANEDLGEMEGIDQVINFTL